jgi:hypothetical protein
MKTPSYRLFNKKGKDIKDFQNVNNLVNFLLPDLHDYIIIKKDSTIIKACDFEEIVGNPKFIRHKISQILKEKYE